MEETDYLHKILAEELEGDKKYKMLFNSIDEGFCIIEMIFDSDNKPVDYRFLEVNTAFEKQTGLYDATGKTVREMVPEHEEHWFEIYGEIALTGKSKRFENPAKELNMFYNVYAFKIGGQESRKVAVLFKDISERKKAEEKLKESEILYRQFFDNPLNGFALCETIIDNKGEPADFVYMEVNKAFEGFTGLKKEKVLNKKVTDIFPYDEVKELIQIYGKVALTGESTVFQYPMPSLNKYYEVAAFSPQKKQFIAFFTDITERKKAEEEVLTNLERFYIILSNMRAGVLLVTENNRVEFANEAFCDYFGLEESPEELIGITDSEMLKKIRNVYLDPDNEINLIKKLLAIINQ